MTVLVKTDDKKYARLLFHFPGYFRNYYWRRKCTVSFRFSLVENHSMIRLGKLKKNLLNYFLVEIYSVILGICRPQDN